jgi:DNA polymerase III gamma/tau subunit
MNEDQPLHLKYRPDSLDLVIGQDHAINNLKRLFDGKRIPHTFLFTGPSGCGKTTLARIIAAMLEVPPGNLQEFDAARFGQVEGVRDFIDKTKYAGLGGKPQRMAIIDEAHALSKQAWQPFLLATEQPPAHMFYAFCTTEPEKVPKTIRTRSHAYDLKPVKWDELSEFLRLVRQEEGGTLRVKEEFIDMAARAANGSVRQALVNLSLLDGIISKQEAAVLLASSDADGNQPAVELARMLFTGKGLTWPNLRKLLEETADMNNESLRILICNYTANAMMNPQAGTLGERGLAVLDAFRHPMQQSEGRAPLLLAIGTLLVQ